MSLLRSSLLAVGFLAAFLTTAVGSSQVYLSFSGGGGSPLTITITQPITFTLTQTGGLPAILFLIKGTNSAGVGGAVTGTTTFTVNAGAPVTLADLSSNYTNNDCVPGDLYFYSIPLVTPAVGDVVVLGAGTIITTNNIALPAPASGSYTMFVMDNYGERISGDGLQGPAFTTLTQGEWDYAPKRSATGIIEDRGVTIDASTNKLRIGSSGLYYDFTSAGAVRDFLPSSGTPRVPPASAINPLRNKVTDNTFAAQLVSLTLNIRANTGFAAGLIDSDHASLTAAQKTYLTAKSITTVQNLLDRGNAVFGGAPSAKGEPGVITGLLDLVNRSFPGGVGSGVVE
jgi:hypothetical protein